MVLLVILLVILMLFALWAAMTALLLRAAIALALASATIAIIMFQLNAPYAGVFELSVCAGLIPVIFVSVISLAHRLPLKEYLKRRESRIHRFWMLPILVILVLVALSFARFPLNPGLPYPEAIKDVRQVMWDYKRFDLFGQIMALLAGAYGVVVLFKREKGK